jgi:hypothetical protein
MRYLGLISSGFIQWLQYLARTSIPFLTYQLKCHAAIVPLDMGHKASHLPQPIAGYKWHAYSFAACRRQPAGKWITMGSSETANKCIGREIIRSDQIRSDNFLQIDHKKGHKRRKPQLPP